MASLQRNVAGQNMTFSLVSTTTGLGVAGATVVGFVVKDNGAQASIAGTTTNSGNGQYNYAPTQAETNAVDVGFFFTATGCIPANLDFHTDQTDASGFIKVDLEDVGGASLATHAAGMVPADVRDIVGAAVSTTSAQLGVNAVQINGVATTPVTTINANVGTTQPVNFTGAGASALVQSDGRDISGVPISPTTAQLGVNVVNWGNTAVGSVPPDVIFLRNGTAQGGSANTITLDAGASAVNNFYNGATVFIRSGTGAGQTNSITGYVGSTKVATVGANWATNPDATSVFTIAAFGPVQATVAGTVTANVTQWNGVAVSVPATPGIPDVNAKNINNHAATTDSNNFLQVDVEAVNASTVAAQNVSKANQAIGRGICAAGSTVMTINTSALTPGGAGIVTGQFIGRTIIFDATTGTAALQGQASNITGNTAGAAPSITVSPLTTAPSAGDVFGIY